MNPRNHPLFKQYPLNRQVTISTGEVPTPYHIYDGYGVFIGGLADLAATQRLLQPENVAPIQTTDGQALMGVWVCDFTEASLGPHHELQLSLFVSGRRLEPVAPHPLRLLSLLLTRPEVQMLCHGLWNNTPQVVTYNRELLSLNARRAGSQIEREPRRLKFAFNDHATQQPIVAGVVHTPQRPSWRASWALMSQLGFRRGLAIAQQPWVSLQVLNPVGVQLDRNAVAETFTRNATNVVRYFNHGTDKIEFGETPYRALQFQPQFVQYMDGFKFVYLNPR